jgi:hypothetical protein
VANQSIPILVFSGGEIGQEVMARANLETYPASASRMENFWPDTVGQLVARPGFCFKFQIPGDVETHLYSFRFNRRQVYGLVVTDEELRITQDGGLLIRPEVDCVIANSQFTTDIDDWDDVSPVPTGDDGTDGTVGSGDSGNQPPGGQEGGGTIVGALFEGHSN